MDIEYDLYADAHTHTDMYTVHQTNFFFSETVYSFRDKGWYERVPSRKTEWVYWVVEWLSEPWPIDRPRQSKQGGCGGVGV